MSIEILSGRAGRKLASAVVAAVYVIVPIGLSGGALPAAAAPGPLADPKQARCLALSMYWEAKAEGEAGMRAVGHVVLNRVRHAKFPDDPCNVVYQGGEKPPCQFSWYCDGRSDRPREMTHWAQAKGLAQKLLDGELSDTTEGALFFHAKRLRAPWRVPRKRTVVIGNHVFYK